ncbi:hypothetical protein ACFYLX_16585 [Pseudarthrobacter enclensis]|uniref:hypothetical protein n=1 Tax=Pseudarthrobacter enclensis TaxID=993070 RepID=UPI003694140C
MNAFWIAAALLAAGFGGWPVTALVFRLARTIDDRADAAKAAEQERAAQEDPAADVTVDPELRPQGPSASAKPGQSDGESVDGELTAASGQPASGVPGGGAGPRILRGGAIIGVLERLGVCLAILTGQPVAIAYIVAIKGLGRFAELKETPVAAERFIIGTLASMLWAAGIAAAVKVIFLA